VKPEQLISNGCKPSLGKVSKCWAEKGGRRRKYLIPSFLQNDHGKFNPTATAWGGGAFWDRTPQDFDNDYFKMFANESFDNKNNCCGSWGYVREYKGCRHTGTMVKRGGKEKIGTPCDNNWCRKDGGNRETMQSTRGWAEPEHKFINKAGAWSPTRKLIRLAGDWALLGHNESRAAVQAYAKDQAVFHSAFAKAFGKVLHKGQEDSVELCKGA